MESVTYVAALFNLRKREGQDMDTDHFSSIQMYLSAAIPVLDSPFPFVIFCEPDLVAPLRERRGSNPTIFHAMEFEQLPFWNLYPTIENNNKTNPVVYVSPEKFTPLYYLVINHKAEFVRRVADENPFKTEWFAWTDMRITLPETKLSGLTQWWDPERANLTMMGLIDRNRLKDRYSFFRNNHGWIAGGFFAGKRQPILDFTTTVVTEWKKALNEQFCPSDETMFTYVGCAYPDTVTYVSFGNYADLLRNQAAVCQRANVVYSIQEFALVKDELRISVKAGEGLRRGYLAGFLNHMADHEKFHIFYRLKLAYEQQGRFALAAERARELLTNPEMRPMIERFAPHLSDGV
jgi:Bacterial protein of unknown function (HtrL_YibB)